MKQVSENCNLLSLPLPPASFGSRALPSYESINLTKALTSCYDCLYQESSLSWHLTGAGCRKPLHPGSQTEHACIHYSAEESSHQKLSVSITVGGLGRDREFVLSLDVSTKSTTWNEADFILDCSHIYQIWQNPDSLFLTVVFYFRASLLPRFSLFAELQQRVPSQSCFLVTVSSCYVCLAHGMLFFVFSTQIPCCSLIYLKYFKSMGTVI